MLLYECLFSHLVISLYHCFLFVRHVNDQTKNQSDRKKDITKHITLLSDEECLKLKSCLKPPHVVLNEVLLPVEGSFFLPPEVQQQKANGQTTSPSAQLQQSHVKWKPRYVVLFNDRIELRKKTTKIEGQSNEYTNDNVINNSTPTSPSLGVKSNNLTINHLTQVTVSDHISRKSSSNTLSSPCSNKKRQVIKIIFKNIENDENNENDNGNNDDNGNDRHNNKSGGEGSMVSISLLDDIREGEDLSLIHI